MTDKTLGAYQRTTPDPDETTGEALARLQAEIAGLEEEAARDDALARLDALGDDGTALRCAVMIAQAGAGVDTAAEFCEQVARGEDVNVAARAEKAEKERDEAVEALGTTLGRAMKAERERDEERARADAAGSRPPAPAITDEMVERAKVTLEALAGGSYYDSTIESVLAAALTSEPQRPAWLYAPAVRAWHRNDGRTEHDGTPGKPRIWSPDYGTTDTWSTPSLREVPWTDLVDVEPLDVSAELAEGLDRVAEFMSTGMVRAREDGAT